MAEPIEGQVIRADSVEQPPNGAVALAYALFGLSALFALFNLAMLFLAPLIGVLGIVGVIVAYAVADKARGTRLESHVRWLTRTFWWSLIWSVIGGLFFVTLGLILIGIPIAIGIWLVATIWVAYRVVRGFLRFSDKQPAPT